MPKCKFCVPAGEVNCCGLTKEDEPKVEMGSLVVCENNTFPGFEFCPEHLSSRGVNVAKLTAEYIADKEK